MRTPKDKQVSTLHTERITKAIKAEPVTEQEIDIFAQYAPHQVESHWDAIANHIYTMGLGE